MYTDTNTKGWSHPAPSLMHSKEKYTKKVLVHVSETEQCTSIMNFTHSNMRTHMDNPIATRCCTLQFIHVPI